MNPPMYLDYNVTNPIVPEVVAAMESYLHGHFEVSQYIDEES